MNLKLWVPVACIAMVHGRVIPRDIYLVSGYCSLRGANVRFDPVLIQHTCRGTVETKTCKKMPKAASRQGGCLKDYITAENPEIVSFYLYVACRFANKHTERVQISTWSQMNHPSVAKRLAVCTR